MYVHQREVRCHYFYAVFVSASEDPPSYDSLFGKLKTAKATSSDNRQFLVTAWAIFSASSKFCRVSFNINYTVWETDYFLTLYYMYTWDRRIFTINLSILWTFISIVVVNLIVLLIFVAVPVSAIVMGKSLFVFFFFF